MTPTIYEEVVEGQFLRTALGNWYFWTKGGSAARLVKRATTNTMPICNTLSAKRWNMCRNIEGSQVFKGKLLLAVLV